VEDFYEHIDDYKNGLLKGEALDLFKAELSQNESLRIAVDNYDTAKSISEGLLEVDMMETLRGIPKREAQITNDNKSEVSSVSETKQKSENEGSDDHLSENINRSGKKLGPPSIPRGETKVKRIIFRRLAIAASFIGLIALCSWWMITYNANQEYIAYVQNNYTQPVDEDATKSVELDTIGKTPFQIGKEYFKRNYFKESEKWFLLALEKETDKKLRSEGHYWLGSVHIELGDVDAARKAWEESEEEGAKESMKVLVDGKKR
jgi:tetratricopeptide (TPR) repeat protein